MYPTSHEHHLSLHKNSQLNDIKPQHKVLGCFLIVLSIAFSNVENNLQIVSHIVIVMYILYLSDLDENILNKNSFKNISKETDSRYPFHSICIIFTFFK